MIQTFTLEQANKALIFVKPILKDIQLSWHELRKLKIEGEPDEIKIHKEMKKIEYYLEEIKQVGCSIRDLEKGIIDFPSYFKDQAVYLCWRPGEEKIENWHGIKTHCKNRMEIDEEFIHFNRSEKDSPAVTH